ncbi:hypothetical protein BWD09_04260 [Neisseria dentiae]|uniref:Uncharacterized protein n=1 Tax=Neisseria dentiae TaxID=194197 RepID=A0A1X3DE36_9NEIS|nr:hypothetical protein [Neisseria dentiae]OSI17972.1 hypothetical protein BWD09_04260 [Neisseria dentiae]QMT45109.1 hypothetical protein H3L92_12030 [Neisseria dentiae]
MGWSTGESKFSKNDNLSETDWKDYQGKNISSITVEISKAQFEQLESYPKLAAAGRIPGFRSVYDAGDNSCIDFSGKGLGYIGLADKDFDGSGLFWARPDKQVNAFLEQIAKHRPQGADLTVTHRGHTYTFGENERGVEKFWKTVDPYWYLGENQRQEPNPEQPQYAHAISEPFFERMSENTDIATVDISQPLPKNATDQEFIDYAFAALLSDDEELHDKALESLMASDQAKQFERESMQAAIDYDREQEMLRPRGPVMSL